MSGTTTPVVGGVGGVGVVATTGFATLPTAAVAVGMIVAGFSLLRFGSLRRQDRRARA